MKSKRSLCGLSPSVTGETRRKKKVVTVSVVYSFIFMLCFVCAGPVCCLCLFVVCFVSACKVDVASLSCSERCL